MTKNKYFEKIISSLGLFSKHFLFAVFLCFLTFLFYIAMLVIDISSALNYTPSVEDINKKIQSVSIRKDLIKKIENFIALRQREDFGLPDRNPFLPYQKKSENVSGGESGAVSDVPSPEILP